MAFNRFDYLELGEDADDTSPQRQDNNPTTPPQSATSQRSRSTRAKSAHDIDSAQQNREPQPWSGQYEPISPIPADQPEPRPPLLTTNEPPAVLPVTTDGIEIRAVEVFGSRGSAAGQFNFPTGLAVDNAGILFIADVYNHRVQRITPDGGVSIVGTRGSARTQFLAPMAVAVDINRAFYVVEQGNNRVQKFSAEGVLELIFGKRGEREGEFRAPMGIFISPVSGDILVADTGNGRVQRFSQAGEFLGALGAAGSLQPPLTNPQSVTCDYLGNIYVADTLANRIARYDPLGRFTGHFGGAPSRSITSIAPNTRFTEPHAIACNSRGELFIADGNSGPGRIVVMTSDTGTVRATIDDPGRGLGRFSRPSGVAISPRMRHGYSDAIPRSDLYLADTMNHRIIRFTST